MPEGERPKAATTSVTCSDEACGMAMPNPMPVLIVSSRCFKASKTLSRYCGSIRCVDTSRSTISVIAGHRSVVFISGIISPTVSKLDSVMRLDPPRYQRSPTWQDELPAGNVRLTVRTEGVSATMVKGLAFAYVS